MICKKASLFDVIGCETTVSTLEINNISFGDENGNSRLEILVLALGILVLV